jgi:hypothetical protein
MEVKVLYSKEISAYSMIYHFLPSDSMTNPNLMNTVREIYSAQNLKVIYFEMDNQIYFTMLHFRLVQSHPLVPHFLLFLEDFQDRWFYPPKKVDREAFLNYVYHVDHFITLQRIPPKLITRFDGN